MIVLDPGHGGHDPGAETDGLEEADLMLEMAGLLAEDLLRTGLFEVVLTREDDTFLPLEARLSVARDAGAYLFLSLHADALPDDAGHASGITLYRLSDKAAAEAVETRVERQDGDDLLKSTDLTGVGDDVALALIDMALRDTVPRTEALSARMLEAIEAAELATNVRPERRGDYAVLKGADIPSLLIELGYLSSEAHVARLTSEKWQQEASRAVRNGILQWFEEDRIIRDAMGK